MLIAKWLLAIFAGSAPAHAAARSVPAGPQRDAARQTSGSSR